MQSTTRPENKRSVMFSNEDNQMIFSLLGNNCQSLSTSVIELYETKPPGHRDWSKKAVGVLCFVKDNNKKNYFFRMYCFVNKIMIWEQELYSKMDYTSPTSFMHSFEGDNCIIAFNFSNETEADHMKEIVVGRLDAKARREAKRLRGQNNHAQNNHVPLKNTMENTFQPTLKISQNQKRRRNITKADIGTPQDFKHVQHIGWNKDTGMEFRTKDTALSELIYKAGLSENQMQDRETRDFVYDFIIKNDKNRIIKDEQVVKERRAPPAIPTSYNSQPSSLSSIPPSPSAAPGPPGPPVPPRSGSKPTPNRAAPPPPPSVTQAATHEHNNHNNMNNMRAHAPPPRPPVINRGPSTKTALPPPPPLNAPAPPPPPPSLPPMTPVSPPPMPPMMPTGVPDTQPDGRSALLESIRSGATLRPVAHNADNHDKPRGDDARGDLLSEIRKGFQLKPCNEREVKPISPAAEAQANGVNDLAAALSRALAERNRVIHPDDDEDDESSDSNDDWDD